ncbi:hypothetical protein A2U01_0071735, partial [Trifolium medium]|nr:hypothetical protein [Trifolium medium]
MNPATSMLHFTNAVGSSCQVIGCICVCTNVVVLRLELCLLLDL